jgi:hypothetical protein
MDEEMRDQGDAALAILAKSIDRRELELLGKLPVEESPTAEQRFIKGGRVASDRANSFVAVHGEGKP